MPVAADEEKAVLTQFLDAQRERALEVVAGLDGAQLNTAALPSGWSPLGLIEHLGHAERHWFQRVVRGHAEPLTWPAESGDGDRFVTTRSPGQVVGFYRDQIARANDVIGVTPLGYRPRGRHGDGSGADVADLRFVILHMIEETARHLGHLDAARELIDGRTGLGQDDL